MTSHVAVPARGAASSVGWRSIAVLAATLLAALALYGTGVLLPYFVNGLHRLPLTEVAGGAHDPKDLWPRSGWGGAVQLTGFLGLLVVPLVSISAAGVGAVWLAVLRRRAESQRLAKALVLLVVVAVAVAALLFVWSPTGALLQAWRMD